MRQVDERQFAHALAQRGLKQSDMAVALLWFRNRSVAGVEATAAELGAILHGHALAARINTSRLKEQLAKHKATVRGASSGTFKIRLASLSELDQSFEPLLGGRAPKVEHALLPIGQTQGSRRYIERLALQLNGTYEGGFYDACAVMVRRLAEILLIEAFEHAQKSAAIKVNNEYVGFGDMIGVAGSGKAIKLARGSPRALDRIKAVGDTAAHNRTYVTSKNDIDDIAHEFRTVINELMNLAGIRPAQ